MKTNRYRSTLYKAFKRAILTYSAEEETHKEFGFRDALIDLRHLADEWGLDFGLHDDHAHAGYLEEIEEAQTRKLRAPRGTMSGSVQEKNT